MPRLLVPALSALLVTLLGAVGIVGVTSVPGATRIDAIAASAPAQIELAVRRCPHCGWIESKREVLPSADPRSPQTYEYTVRMADGSSSIFLEALPTSWRLKERLIVIGGARPHH
jgi:cobalamin biosynthesis protein CbiG